MSKTFASISNGIVHNLIMAETLEIAEAVTNLTCVEYTDPETVGKDWVYDGNVFTNLNPTPQTGPPAPSLQP